MDLDLRPLISLKSCNVANLRGLITRKLSIVDVNAIDAPALQVIEASM